MAKGSLLDVPNKVKCTKTWIFQMAESLLLIKVYSYFIFHKNNLLWTSARKQGKRAFPPLLKEYTVYSLLLAKQFI